MKYTWIKDYSAHYPVARLCRLCGVSRTGFMQWKTRPMSCTATANIALDQRVLQLHVDSGRSYGRPRLLRALKAQGVRVGAERIRRSLQRQQLRPVYTRPYRVTTDSNHAKPVAAHVLNRRFDGWPPNRVWVSDITYVPTAEGWLYLACVLDLGSRRIVGWSMNTRMTSELVCNALNMAYWRRKPGPGLIFHSDRGSQYARAQFRTLIDQYQIIQSMSRKANCWDNAPMESFFKSLKVECAHRLKSHTRDMARLNLVDWIEGFYNAQRLHSALDYQAPNKYERSLSAA